VNPTITAVAGLEAGHYTDLDHGTGCTVFICRQGAVGGVDVRGGSPGTRETDLLRPVHRVDRVHGLVLSGGSAFGLDAASGVMDYLAGEGIGFQIGPAVVPIVPAAILFDLGLVSSDVRPGAAEGRAACLAAGPGPLEEGSVGAGTGATVAKARGMAAAVKSGMGSASMKLPGGPVVAAAVAVNAYGGVFDHPTGLLLAGPRKENEPGFDDPVAASLRGGAPPRGARLGNTTIGVVATDAPLNKEEANYLASVSHDGLALTVRPCHTIFDGDTLFALSTGTSSEPVELTRLGVAAVEVTAEAVVRAVKTATGLGGVPAVSEVARG
jgi:L-aminopeptidase/D-esterase-like protein